MKKRKSAFISWEKLNDFCILSKKEFNKKYKITKQNKEQR